MSLIQEQLRGHDSVRQLVAEVLPSLRTEGVSSVLMFSGVRDDQGTSVIAEAFAEALTETGRSAALAVVAADVREIREDPRSADPDGPAEMAAVRLQVPLGLAGTQLVEQLREFIQGRVEVVVLDAEPLSTTFSRVSAPAVDGVIVVLDGEKSSVRGALRVTAELEDAGAVCLGVVLNRYRERIPGFIQRLFE